MAVAPQGDAEAGGARDELRRAYERARTGEVDLVDLVCDVLGPRQVELGDAWLRAEVMVSDEHRQSALVDRLLVQLELRHPPPPDGGRPVVCVSAEGDWHALPSRMVALVLAASGHVPEFYGASLPAEDLVDVARTRRAAVAISCATVAALPGAARCVEAAGREGVPVVVGGHAFEQAPEAAAALGVGVGSDLRRLPSQLAAARPPTTCGHLDHAAVAELDLVAPAVAARAGEALGRDMPPAVGEEVVRYLLGFARGALCFRAPAVAGRHAGWLQDFLAARGAAPDLDRLAGATVAAARDAGAPRALEAVLEAVAGPGRTPG